MSEEKPIEYDIASFEDFLKVPEEKLDACLADFCQYIKMFYAMNGLGNVIGDLLVESGEAEEDEVRLAEGVSLASSGFRWIDDGKEGLSGAEINLIAVDPETREELSRSQIKYEVTEDVPDSD